MWLFTVLLACFCLAPARAADNAAKAAKKEQKLFQGTWKATKLIYNGKDVLADGELTLKLVIKGDVATVESTKKVKKEYPKIRLKLDPSTKTKIVDMTVLGGVQKDAVIEGIYAIKGKELKICAKVFGTERPDKFESKEGTSVVLLVLMKE
jgi:uncharacterized protein (TIGR03067 family)